MYILYITLADLNHQKWKFYPFSHKICQQVIWISFFYNIFLTSYRLNTFYLHNYCLSVELSLWLYYYTFAFYYLFIENSTILQVQLIFSFFFKLLMLFYPNNFMYLVILDEKLTSMFHMSVSKTSLGFLLDQIYWKAYSTKVFDI